MWNSHTSGSTPWKYVRDDSGAVVVDPAVASQILEAFHRYGYYRCSTAHRRGREACEQPMVREDVFETQIAAYIVGMRLPPEYLGEVMDELRRRNRSIGADPFGLEKRRRELGRWHRLFVLGEIDEETLSRETAPLKAALAEVDEPREAIDIREAMAYWAPFLVVWRPKRVAGKKFEN